MTTVLSPDIETTEKPVVRQPRSPRTFHLVLTDRLNAAREMGVQVQVVYGQWINPAIDGGFVRGPSDLPGPASMCQDCKDSLEPVTETA